MSQSVMHQALKLVQEMWDELDRLKLNPLLMRQYSDAIAAIEKELAMHTAQVADSEALVQAIAKHIDGWRSATFGWQDNADPAIAERNKQTAIQEHAAECLRRIQTATAGAAGPAGAGETNEAVRVCHETYVAIGTYLFDLDEAGHLQAGKLLDNLSQARLANKDVIPFDPPPVIKSNDAKDAARWRALKRLNGEVRWMQSGYYTSSNDWGGLDTAIDAAMSTHQPKDSSND